MINREKDNAGFVHQDEIYMGDGWGSNWKKIAKEEPKSQALSDDDDDDIF